MLDSIQSCAGSARSAPDPSAGLDSCLRRLRQHRLIPHLAGTTRGTVAGGLAMRVSLSAYLESSEVAGALNEQLRRLLSWRVPVTIALTDPGNANGTTDTAGILETFCLAVRDAVPDQLLGHGLIGTSIRSHVMPLQAYLVITSLLGNGPRYVVLDSLQMHHHADSRVQAVTDANWIELWHRRHAGGALQAVYAESVRSHCSLLSDEKTAAILPALAMPVPAETAWLPIEMYLPDYSDGRGHLNMDAVRAALHACLDTSDNLARQLFWPSETQQLDCRTNNRVALQLTGIGDLVTERHMAPTDIHCLRWVEAIVRVVQNELLNTSREMARHSEILPSLLQSDPSNAVHIAGQKHDWSSRWRQTLQAEAVRHRNLLVLSPYSVVLRAGECSSDFTDLLPVLAHADAVSFRDAPALANWNVSEFSRFHRRAWAVIMRESPRPHVRD